jgi:cation transport regulator ChaC
MESTPNTTFWSAISIITAAVGGIFFVLISHAETPKHPEAAHEDDVGRIEVTVARVETRVGHNTRVLEELKLDLRELRVEQSNANQRILEAIGGSQDGR